MMPAPTITTSALSRMDGPLPQAGACRIIALRAAAARRAPPRRSRDDGRTDDGLPPHGDPPARAIAHALRPHRDREPARRPLDPPRHLRPALPAGHPARPRLRPHGGAA